MSPGQKHRGTSLRLFAAAFAAAILLVLLIYGQNLGYALLGHDTYPIILTARIQDAGDLLDTVTAELMDGRYPKGYFYRPVLNLSFAVDHAIWGMRPWGYHITDLLILSLSACLLPFLFRPGGRRFLPAAVLAGLFFVLHPVHAAILPVAARRGDTLALLFIVLALIMSRRPGWAGRWQSALFSLLAIGSKETGILALPLLCIYTQFAPSFGKIAGNVAGSAAGGDSGDQAGGPGPLKRAWRAAALPGLAVVLFVAARQTVLGGTGGHEELSWQAFWNHLLMIRPHFESAVFYRYPLFDFLLPEATARTVLVVVFAAASVALLRKPDVRPAIVFAWSWLVLGWAVHGLSLAGGEWYTLHVMAPFALIFGILLQEALVSLRESRPPILRSGSALVALLLLVVFGTNLCLAPPFRHYSRWSVLTERIDRFLGDLDVKLEAAEPGQTITSLPLPRNAPGKPDAPEPRVPPIKDYTIQAWVELKYPDREIRVSFPVPRPPKPDADEILVVVPVRR